MSRIVKTVFASCLILCLLTGCNRTTTVILVPESTSSGTIAGTAAATTSTASVTDTAVSHDNTTEPATISTALPDSGLTSTPTTVPATGFADTPTANPASAPETTPTSAPTTAPTSAPTTAPTSAPVTEPTTEPATFPTTEPTSEPVTAPSESASDVYDISTYTADSLAYEVLAEINGYRVREGLPELSMDTTLCALSAIRAYECTIDFSHIRPDGRDCFSVLDDYGYINWTCAGENLLYGTEGFTAAQMVTAWMNSEGHRANILSAGYSRAGIGICCTNGYIYIANLFVG